MQVVCLIADIVESRDIVDRAAFQLRLEGGLQSLNGSVGAGLLSPYTITLGDEFQAVYVDFSTVLVDILTILRASYPQRIRFSLGRGELSTAVNRERALGMDGPAFHAARRQLEELKRRGETVIAVNCGAGTVDGLVRDGLLVLSRELGRWNLTALGAAEGLLRGRSIRDMAAAAGVKERMVYKSISQNGLRDYASFIVSLSRVLDGGER